MGPAEVWSGEKRCCASANASGKAATHLEAGVSEVADGLVRVVHGQGDTAPVLEGEHLGGGGTATDGRVDDFHLRRGAGVMTNHSRGGL